MKKIKLAWLFLLYMAVFASVIALQAYVLRNDEARAAVNLATAGIGIVSGGVFWLLLREKNVKPSNEEDHTAKYVTKEKYRAVVSGFGFTKRELELGFLIVSGYSNARIAEELFISETTVKKHVTHIYEKAGVQGRKQFKNLFG